MELNGKILLIGQTETVGSQGTFKKRQLLIVTDEQYPQKIAIDFLQTKTTILDSYSIGQDVEVSVYVRGNEYNGKYYVTLQGWKIALSGQTSQPAPAPQQNDYSHATPIGQENEPDDLAF